MQLTEIRKKLPPELKGIPNYSLMRLIASSLEAALEAGDDKEMDWFFDRLADMDVVPLEGFELDAIDNLPFISLEALAERSGLGVNTLTAYASRGQWSTIEKHLLKGEKLIVLDKRSKIIVLT